MEERIRDSHPYVGMFPGAPDFILIVADVLIGAVSRENVCDAGTTRGSLEPRLAGDDLIREHPAVTPTTHGQPSGIGNALRDGIIDCRQNVLGIDVAPVGVDCLRIILASSGTAARVGGNYYISMCCEELPVRHKFVT